MGRFRWYYLLALLPVALFFGARWYADHRIQGLIERGNADDNELSVGNYEFGFFPPRLTARELRFRQDRGNVKLNGKLDQLEIDRLSITSLFGDSAIRVNGLRLFGPDFDLTVGEADRDSTGKKSKPFAIDRISVDSGFVRLTLPGDRRFNATNTSLALNRFVSNSLPPPDSLLLLADSLEYRAGELHVVVYKPQFGGDPGNLTGEGLTVDHSRGSADLGAFALFGLSNRDRLDSLNLDSLRADINQLAYTTESGPVVLSSGTLTAGAAERRGSAFSVDRVAVKLASAAYESKEPVTVYDLDLTLTGAGGGTDSSYTAERADLSFSSANYATDKPLSAEATDLTLRGIAYGAGELAIDLGLAAGRKFVRKDGSGKEITIVEDFNLSQAALTFPFRRETLGDTEVKIASLRFPTRGEPKFYVLEEIQYGKGALNIQRFARGNDLGFTGFHESIDKVTWMAYNMGPINLRGIDHTGLVRDNNLTAGSLSIQSLDLKAIEQYKTIPPPDGDQEQTKVAAEDVRKMPVEALRAIGMPMRIPRIVVRDAHIVYGIVDTMLNAKEIHWEGRVEVDGLDTRISTRDSVIATYDAVFQDTSEIKARFALSRGRSGRDYGMSGELRDYPFYNINPLMEVAADARIESGDIRLMRYNGFMRNDTIRGDMVFLYDNLDVKLVGSGAWFKNLLSGLVVKNDNHRGEDFRPGYLFHVHARDKSFFHGYWRGLVTGLRSSALSDLVTSKPDE